jgi:hypothetical protein
VSGRRKPSARDRRRAEIEANNLRVSARYAPEPMRLDADTTERVRRAAQTMAQRQPGTVPADVLRHAVVIGLEQIVDPEPDSPTRHLCVLPASMELVDLERVISDGMRSFVDVGRALSRIRDEKLYQATHATFEAYCRERWEFTRSYAHRLIGAAGVVANWQHELPPPANEAQARELAKLPAEQQAEAWAEVIEVAADGKVTAKLVANVVAKRRPPDDRAARVAELASVDIDTAREVIELEKTDPEKFEAVRAGRLDLDSASPAPPRFETVRVADLEALAAQRVADPEFSASTSLLKFMPSRGARMAVFALAGGELALLRLGLDWTVTPEKLKAAHREACRSAHPDRGGTAEEFIAVNAAHKLIADMLAASEAVAA